MNVAASPADKTYANQLKGAAILEPIFKRQPQHPGVAHYLIHLHDYPPIAEKGLDAALANQMRVEAAAGTAGLQRLVGELRKVTAWPPTGDNNPAETFIKMTIHGGSRSLSYACAGLRGRDLQITSNDIESGKIDADKSAGRSRFTGGNDTMLAPGRTSRAPGTSCLGAARFSRLRGRLHGLLDSAREDLTWMRADHPVARDHHGAEAPLVGGLR